MDAGCSASARRPRRSTQAPKQQPDQLKLSAIRDAPEEVQGLPGEATSHELQGRSRRLRTARRIVIRPSLPPSGGDPCGRGGTKQKLEASIFFFVENCGAFFSSQSMQY